MRRSIVHISAAVGVAAAGLAAAGPALAGAGHASSDGMLVRHGTAIPEGATATVKAVYPSSGKSTVMLHVRGLLPNTKYGAHAHNNSCGLDPLASGGHFQYLVAPIGKTTDPAYANSRNEIWLDFTTNAAGNGVAKAVVPWQFAADRRAKSVVIHQQHTSTAPGSAGTAGPRLACINVGF